MAQVVRSLVVAVLAGAAAGAVLLPGGVFLGDTEFEACDPPLLAAALFLPVFPLCGLVVAALAALGLAAALRNLAELA